MKNFAVLLSKLVFLTSLLWIFSGCASSILLKTSEPQSIEAVFQQIIASTDEIERFTLNSGFEIQTASNDTIKTAGTVKFTQPASWKITIDGPMGMKMAIIELEGDDYSVTIPSLGQSFNGNIRDSEALRARNVELPRFNLLSTILMPSPFIEEPDGWSISESSSFSSGKMVLNNEQNAGEMVIHFSRKPFRVNSEQRYENGDLLYSRAFSYDGKSTVPSEILIDVDDIALKIVVRSWKIETKSTV